MSVQAFVWARGKAPTIAAQCVLFALADYADRSGITYVGQARLARACSCGERTVRENLLRLERAGLIKRIRRNDRRGYRSSDWTILAPLAVDREGMEPFDEREWRQGQCPEDVALFAQECDDREWAAEMLALPADDAGRAAGGDDSRSPTGGFLPADDAAPTGRSLHAYRQIAPSLPADDAVLPADPAGYPSVEHQLEIQLGSQQASPPSPLTTADGEPVLDAADDQEGGRENDSTSGDEDHRHDTVPCPCGGCGLTLTRPRTAPGLQWLRWQGELAFAESFEIDEAAVRELEVDELLDALRAEVPA